MKTDKLEWKGARGVFDLSLLRKVENEKKVSFPESYKEIVEKYNGACPSKVLVKTESGREVVFDSLINWDESRKANIFFWIEVLQNENNNSNLVPFGKDPFGNLFCFLADSQYEVVFWSHESNSLDKISKTFDSFLANLY